MSWSTNRYYCLAEENPKALLLAANTLHLYPLTRSCLEILGQNLLKHVDFGFFTEGYEVIVQGESGRDIFLLCRGTIEVVVDDRLIVQMEAPTLLGDKALVEPNSTRSATIRVAKDSVCLFIKIPMQLFIRDYNDDTIQDHEFTQEVAIFQNVFDEIQKRLFEYIELQNHLLDEVNTTLSLLNIQAISEMLDKKQDPGWDPVIWQFVRKALRTHFKFNWPKNIKLNINTFREVLMRVLEYQYPQERFRGTDEEYVRKKNMVWRSWLGKVSSALIRVLPPHSLPMQLESFNLFNPRNFQMQMNQFLTGIEHRFRSKKNTGPAYAMITPKNFFGRGDHANEFSLKRYLSFFEDAFALKNRRRVEAQIAQRVALITANCENEFNASVIQMQQFLDKAKGKNVKKSNDRETRIANATAILEKKINLLIQATWNYFSRVNLSAHNRRKVQFDLKLTPPITEIAKKAPKRELKEEVEQAYSQVMTIFNIRGDVLSPSFVRESIHLCYLAPADTVPEHELLEHYWIPITTDIQIMEGNQCIGVAKRAHMIGGKGWKGGRRGTEEIHLKLPEREIGEKKKASVILIIPNMRFPWFQNKQPHADEFKRDYVHLMQWIVDKHIAHLQILVIERDQLYQNWLEAEQIRYQETKSKEFENQDVILSGDELRDIQSLLSNAIGMNFQLEEGPITSKSLAKKLYNHLINHMKETHPGFTVEERSNKAYTKWRFLIGEIVQKMGQQDIEKILQQHAPEPVFEILQSEVCNILSSQLDSGQQKAVALSALEPSFNLEDVFVETRLKPAMSIKLFEMCQHALEEHVYKVLNELYQLQSKIDQQELDKSKSDLDAVHQQMILEAIEQFYLELDPEGIFVPVQRSKEEQMADVMDELNDILG